MDELSRLRKQMASDFESTWRIMGETADRLDTRIDGLTIRFEQLEAAVRDLRTDLKATGRETAEGLRQAQGRMRLVEERFDVFLGVIQKGLEDRPLRAEFEDLKARVERLEGGPPAA